MSSTFWFLDNAVSKDLLYFIKGMAFVAFVSLVKAVGGSADACAESSIPNVEMDEDDEPEEEDDESSELLWLFTLPVVVVLFGVENDVGFCWPSNDVVLPIVTKLGRITPSLTSALGRKFSEYFRPIVCYTVCDKHIYSFWIKNKIK